MENQGETRAAAVDVAMSKYRLVEDAFFKGPWVMGENYTVADGYLYVFCRWVKAAGLLDADRFPKLNAHLTAMQERPAVQRALEVEGIPAV